MSQERVLKAAGKPKRRFSALKTIGIIGGAVVALGVISALFDDEDDDTQGEDKKRAGTSSAGESEPPRTGGDEDDFDDLEDSDDEVLDEDLEDQLA